jgi:hypothetical protein
VYGVQYSKVVCMAEGGGRQKRRSGNATTPRHFSNVGNTGYPISPSCLNLQDHSIQYYGVGETRQLRFRGATRNLIIVRGMQGCAAPVASHWPIVDLRRWSRVTEDFIIEWKGSLNN